VLDGFNELEEKEFYQEPASYLHTEMAGLDTKSQAYEGSEESRGPQLARGRGDGGARRMLLQAGAEVVAETGEGREREREKAGGRVRESGRRERMGRIKGVLERLRAIGRSRMLSRTRVDRGRDRLRGVGRGGRREGWRGGGGDEGEGDGWRVMQRDLDKRSSDLRGQVLMSRTQAGREGLKVMRGRDAASSHSTAERNGRREQRVYRGPNSEIAHAPTHERLGRGWYGADQKYNFPGHWRYYKDTPAKMASKVHPHT
jgi:hypothetical protein